MHRCGTEASSTCHLQASSSLLKGKKKDENAICGPLLGGRHDFSIDASPAAGRRRIIKGQAFRRRFKFVQSTGASRRSGKDWRLPYENVQILERNEMHRSTVMEEQLEETTSR